MVLLTFVVGGLDAVGIDQFGVFTANQAGNLVLVWTFLGTDPASAALAVRIACWAACVGVAAVVTAAAWVAWLAGAAGSRALLGRGRLPHRRGGLRRRRRSDGRRSADRITWWLRGAVDRPSSPSPWPCSASSSSAAEGIVLRSSRRPTRSSTRCGTGPRPGSRRSHLTGHGWHDVRAPSRWRGPSGRATAALLPVGRLGIVVGGRRPRRGCGPVRAACHDADPPTPPYGLGDRGRPPSANRTGSPGRWPASGGPRARCARRIRHSSHLRPRHLGPAVRPARADCGSTSTTW